MTRTERIGMVLLAVFSVALIGMFALWPSPTPHDTGAACDEEMQQLIERLRYASRPDIRIGGEALLLEGHYDPTAANAIIAKGRSAVPCLIQNLDHPNEDVRRHCLALLGSLPSRGSMNALITTLRNPEASEAEADMANASLIELVGDHPPLPGERGPEETWREYLSRMWAPWWQENKDRIVNTETGIGLKNADGTVTPLPVDNWDELTRPEDGRHASED